MLGNGHIEFGCLRDETAISTGRAGLDRLDQSPMAIGALADHADQPFAAGDVDPAVDAIQCAEQRIDTRLRGTELRESAWHRVWPATLSPGGGPTHCLRHSELCGEDRASLRTGRGHFGVVDVLVVDSSGGVVHGLFEEIIVNTAVLP